MDAKKHLKIFVVEDNKIYNRVVCEYLKKLNFKHVTSFYSGKECIKAVVAGASPHIVIQDYHLEDTTGIDVLQNVKKISKRTEFVFLTGNEDMDVAVNPNDADEVHIAGILTWRSMDGGANFNCTADWVPENAANANIGYCHADVDLLLFNGSTLFVGSDGGIFKAENTASYNCINSTS